MEQSGVQSIRESNGGVQIRTDRSQGKRGADGLVVHCIAIESGWRVCATQLHPGTWMVKKQVSGCGTRVLAMKVIVYVGEV